MVHSGNRLFLKGCQGTGGLVLGFYWAQAAMIFFEPESRDQ